MITFGVNAVITHDDQVLLTLRSDLPIWCLPGGAIEAGESLVEAADLVRFDLIVSQRPV